MLLGADSKHPQENATAEDDSGVLSFHLADDGAVIKSTTAAPDPVTFIPLYRAEEKSEFKLPEQPLASAASDEVLAAISEEQKTAAQIATQTPKNFHQQRVTLVKVTQTATETLSTGVNADGLHTTSAKADPRATLNRFLDIREDQKEYQDQISQLPSYHLTPAQQREITIHQITSADGIDAHIIQVVRNLQKQQAPFAIIPQSDQVDYQITYQVDGSLQIQATIPVCLTATDTAGPKPVNGVLTTTAIFRRQRNKIEKTCTDTLAFDPTIAFQLVGQRYFELGGLTHSDELAISLARIVTDRVAGGLISANTIVFHRTGEQRELLLASNDVKVEVPKLDARRKAEYVTSFNGNPKIENLDGQVSGNITSLAHNYALFVDALIAAQPYISIADKTSYDRLIQDSIGHLKTLCNLAIAAGVQPAALGIQAVIAKWYPEILAKQPIDDLSPYEKFQRIQAVLAFASGPQITGIVSASKQLFEIGMSQAEALGYDYHKGTKVNLLFGLYPKAQLEDGAIVSESDGKRSRFFGSEKIRARTLQVFDNPQLAVDVIGKVGMARAGAFEKSAWENFVRVCKKGKEDQSSKAKSAAKEKVLSVEEKALATQRQTAEEYYATNTPQCDHIYQVLNILFKRNDFIVNLKTTQHFVDRYRLACVEDIKPTVWKSGLTQSQIDSIVAFVVAKNNFQDTEQTTAIKQAENLLARTALENPTAFSHLYTFVNCFESIWTPAFAELPGNADFYLFNSLLLDYETNCLSWNDNKLAERQQNIAALYQLLLWINAQPTTPSKFAAVYNKLEPILAREYHFVTNLQADYDRISHPDFIPVNTSARNVASSYFTNFGHFYRTAGKYGLGALLLTAAVLITLAVITQGAIIPVYIALVATGGAGLIGTSLGVGRARSINNDIVENSQQVVIPEATTLTQQQVFVTEPPLVAPLMVEVPYQLVEAPIRLSTELRETYALAPLEDEEASEQKTLTVRTGRSSTYDELRRGPLDVDLHRQHPSPTHSGSPPHTPTSTDEEHAAREAAKEQRGLATPSRGHVPPAHQSGREEVSDDHANAASTGTTAQDAQRRAPSVF